MFTRGFFYPQQYLDIPRYFENAEFQSRIAQIVTDIRLEEFKISVTIMINEMILSTFLAHPSRKLNSAFLIKICPLCVIVIVVGVVVENFSHFHLLLKNHWVNFNQTWHKAFLGEGDLNLLK